MADDDRNETIEELFVKFLSRYQIGLEMQMKGSDFIFECLNSLYCKCHKQNFQTWWFLQ